MPTANVSVNPVGGNVPNGYTVTIGPPPSLLNLDPNLNIYDFNVFQNGTLFQAANPTPVVNGWSKTSTTTLTWTGTSQTSITTIVFQRKTQDAVISPLTYGQRLSSTLWNQELDRTVRWKEEADLNGIGPGSSGITSVLSNGAYPTGWSGDTVFGATRGALFNILSTLAPIASPTFTGVPAAPTATDNTNTTQLATCQYANTRVTNALAAALTLSNGTVASTQAVGDNTTKVATDAFVHNELTSGTETLSASFVLGNGVTATTQAKSDNSTKVATTAYTNANYRPAWLVYNATNNAYSTSLGTVVLSVVSLDTDSAIGTSSIFTCPTGQGGVYFLASLCHINAPSASGINIQIQLLINSTSIAQAVYTTYGTTEDFPLYVSCIASVLAGQTVKVQTNCSGSSTSYTIIGGSGQSYFMGYKLGN